MEKIFLLLFKCDMSSLLCLWHEEKLRSFCFCLFSLKIKSIFIPYFKVSLRHSSACDSDCLKCVLTSFKGREKNSTHTLHPRASPVGRSASLCPIKDTNICTWMSQHQLLPPLRLPGHSFNGCSVFMSPLNCISTVVEAMALCRCPKEEKEGQAANLELAGREQRQHLVSLERRTEGCCSSMETRTNKRDNWRGKEDKCPSSQGGRGTPESDTRLREDRWFSRDNTEQRVGALNVLDGWE